LAGGEAGDLQPDVSRRPSVGRAAGSETRAERT
jgi:hypothetical protein